MVLKHPGPAQTPKTTDFQPNPKPPFAKPPSGNRRQTLAGTEQSEAWRPPGKPCAVDAASIAGRASEQIRQTVGGNLGGPSWIITPGFFYGNRRFGWSGRPRAARKPSKKVGGVAPTFLEGFPAARGRPDPPKIDDLRSVKKS